MNYQAYLFNEVQIKLKLLSFDVEKYVDDILFPFFDFLILPTGSLHFLPLTRFERRCYDISGLYWPIQTGNKPIEFFLIPFDSATRVINTDIIEEYRH